MSRAPEAAELARRIAAAIDESGLTQAQIAERVGVHQVTVSKWKLGTCTPRFLHLLKLERVLGVDLLEDLLWRPGLIR